MGKKPYVIPYGGSNELGAIAYMEAITELHEQVDAGRFTHMVFASGSGGTQAGLVLGKQNCRGHYELVGIAVDKDLENRAPLDRQILDLTNRTAQWIGLEHAFSEEEVVLLTDYVGGGYGVVGEPELEAISLLARTEGILLDPVYTSRAMAGLIDLVRKEKITRDDCVLFWHTGGYPALFTESFKPAVDRTKDQIIR